MKKVIIEKKDLKKRNYDNAVITIEADTDVEKDNNLDEALADLLLSLFKTLNNTVSESGNSNDTMGYVTLRTVREEIAITIQITLDETAIMKQTIVREFISQVKKIDFNHCSVNKIILVVEDDKKVKEVC